MAAFPNRALTPDCKALKRRYFSIWHSSCSELGIGTLPMEFQMQAQENSVALPLRSHTIFGVCEAIGEDFGFNPVFLRIPLAASVVVNPLWAIATYFALGVVVLVSRLLFPKANASQAEIAASPAPANEQRELAKAA
jgi:phage shock protein PspC (stress-responsive transcriptional regulator)